ncbi:MAG: peptide ABC transporter substrate-binding protein [Spirochaetaceae bacterium]|nr:MAG: peptide ABC transporter substrate-binding protein [Spirochaetaceae bacterium]
MYVFSGIPTQLNVASTLSISAGVQRQTGGFMSRYRILVAIAVLALVPSLAFSAGAQQAATSARRQEYRTVYSAEIGSMNYLVSSTVAEMQVAMNTVAGLVEFDSFGVLRPSAAESWTISTDGLVYTFTLREGTHWYTWDGQQYAELVAQDFVDAMAHVLDPATASFSAHHMRGTIRNADAYFLSRADADTPDMSFSEVGIRAVSRYVVEYTLENPTPWFLSILTHSVYRPVNGQFLAEAGDRFGTDHRTLLSNGPFILTNFQPQVERRFERNENYWDRENVNIDSLTFQFNREAGTLAPELFMRGEISSANIPIAIIDGWLQDPEREDLVFPNPVSMWNFWYSFNFDPQFAAEFEPENWRRAVQNINFRRAFFHGLDRVAAHMTIDPFNPERQLKNTMTSPGFVSVQGVDYTMLPPLAPFTSSDLFNPEAAVAYAARAMEELAGEVTFPVIVKWPFSTGSADATQRAQVIEQQLENLFGPEFIDFRPVGYPPTGFLDNTRRNGNFALAEVNWGATYLDPYAYTPPFHTGNPMLYTDISLPAGSAYQDLLDAASAEVLDLDRRYNLLAAAEGFLLENALIIPYRGGGGGYGVSYIQPFTIPFAGAGLANLSFKFAEIRDTPVTSAEFFELQDQWQEDRLVRLREAGQ